MWHPGMFGVDGMAFEVGRSDGNRYVVGGVNTMRDIPLHRSMPTTDRVGQAIREGMAVHETSFEEAASRTGLPRERVVAIARTGQGSPAEVRALLDAVGVIPVTLPPLTTFDGGCR